MGYWRIDSDALAGSRFVVSALAETTAALMALQRRTAAHPGDRAWLADRLPPYRAHLAADPVAAHLVRAALGRLWIADHLTPPPDGRPFEEELEPIRATPDAAVRTYLRAASGALPEELARARGSARARRSCWSGCGPRRSAPTGSAAAGSLRPTSCCAPRS